MNKNIWMIKKLIRKTDIDEAPELNTDTECYFERRPTMGLLKIDSVLSYKGKDYIEKQINPTILGSCLYFNSRNISSCLKKGAKFYEGQYKNYLLLHTISEGDRQKIIKDCKDLKINIRVFSDSSLTNQCVSAPCPFSHASKAYTISFTNGIKLALQELFPISTSLAIATETKNININNDSFLYESIGISPYVEEGGVGGFNLFPVKKINKTNIDNPEINFLLTIAEDYSRGLFLNTSQKKIKDETKHKNAFCNSTIWYDAKDFNRQLLAEQNCIYTLASSPNINGICNIYIGEAKVSGNRLKIFQTQYGTLIDHSINEAILPDRRFTRFRIDMLRPDAHEFLHDAQDSVIGVIHMLQKECPYGFNIVNNALCKSISRASTEDQINRKI